MKKAILIIGLSIILNIINAQTFQKSFGGLDLMSNYSVLITKNKDYLLIGSGLAKTDSLGNIEWAKNYDIGALQSQGYFYDAAETADSGFIATGWTSSSGAGGRDIIVVRTNKFGDTIWTKTYGGNNHDGGLSILQIPEDSNSVPALSKNYLISGYIGGYSGKQGGVFVMKITSIGDTIWTKTYYNDYGGGEGVSIVLTKDSNFVITCVMFRNSFDKAALIKINQKGDILWSKMYGSYSIDWVKDGIQTSDGGFALIGTTLSFAAGGEVDVYLLKTDSVGQLQWSKTYGDAYGDEGYAIRETFDNGFIITGRMELDNRSGASCPPNDKCQIIYTIKADSIGDTLWTKMYGGNEHDYAYDIEVTKDSGYIITGSTRSFAVGLYYPPIASVYMIKTDKNGNTICNCYPTNTIVGSPSSVTWNNNLYTGSGCIVKGAHSGVGNVYAYKDSSLCESVGLVELQSQISKIIISPNPSTGIFQISISGINKDFQISVFSIEGQKIHSQNVLNKEITDLDLSTYPKGIYFIRLWNDDFLKTEKIVLQ